LEGGLAGQGLDWRGFRRVLRVWACFSVFPSFRKVHGTGFVRAGNGGWIQV
jgi:hypothetical protein